MLDFTPTQLVMLAILFVAGWLFGLASHPGGRKWKTRYAAERDANAVLRKESDARVKAADARVAEVERENARLAKAAPVTASTIQRPVAQRPVASSAARPAYSGTGRGWFDFGAR